MSDAMSNAARYAAQRAAGEDSSTNSDDSQPTMSLNAENKSAFIETAIQQAIRRGEFDNLPAAGKPLEKLGTHHDPDGGSDGRSRPRTSAGSARPRSACGWRTSNSTLSSISSRMKRGSARSLTTSIAA